VAHEPNPASDDRSAGRVPALPRVALRAFFAVLLAVLIVVLGVSAFVEWTARAGTPTDGGELSSASRAQLTLVEQRLEALALAAASLAGQPGLPGALEEAESAEASTSAQGATQSSGPDVTPASSAALQPLLRDLLDNRGLDLAVIAGPGGVPLALAGSDEQAARELVGSSSAVRALDQGRARGVWRRDGRLYLSAAARIERDFETLGLVVVAAPIDRAMALEARSLSRADAAFLVPAAGGGVEQVASTLGRDGAAGLVEALDGAGLLEPAMHDGQSASTDDLVLAGRTYRAQVAPLPSPAATGGGTRGAGARGTQGVMVTLVQHVGAAPLVRKVELVAGAAGLAGLLLGGLLAMLAGRGASGPLDEVSAAAERARSGDLAGASRYPIPGPLAQVFADQSEKWSLEAAVAAVGREGGLEHDAGHAERRRGAVLVTEMPRYGRLGPDDEPREVSERLSRDAMRVRRAVSVRGGRVEAALGHRVLATFGGDKSEARAVAAGAEILRRLSERENAFDEPVPPAVAVTAGEVVLGGPEGARTVTGLPVQQAESLLREAASGDLILSKGVHRSLQEALAAGGVELKPQRGLLTPQPVFLLDADAAGRATVALGEGGDPSGGGLSSLAPGMVLADRFELAERLRSDALSVDFLARDRQADSVVVVRALRRELLADLAPFEELDSDIRGVMRAVDPAVARVVALGMGDGVPFIASELAEGPTLARVLGVQRFLAPAGALRLARHLASGLAAIHDTSIPHGDLRPETVVLSPRGNARIIGLGLAPLLPPPGTDTDVDRAFGSPRFLAPERVRGDGPSLAADVWAAGALLVEVFTGRPVYGGGGASDRPSDWQEVRERIASGPREALDPTELPEGLAPVLERCLAREPSERFGHGGELAAALVGIRAAVVQG